MGDQNQDDASWWDDIEQGAEALVLGPLQILSPAYWQGIQDGANSSGIGQQIGQGVADLGTGIAQAATEAGQLVTGSLPSSGEVVAATIALIIILFLVAYIVREVAP